MPKFVAVLFLGAALLLASPAHADPLSKRLLVAAAAADLVTTEISLAQGSKELNPLMRGGTAQRIAIQSAQVAGTLWLASKLERRYPRLTKWGARSVAFTMASLAVHNGFVAVEQARRSKGRR